jgi:hypothetical protein
MDGHTSHINLTVSEFCKDHGIILYCFPAHASHILQPLDVTVFGPLKKSWNHCIDEFKEEFKMPMTKAHFFKVFDQSWKKAIDKKHSIAGFKSTGLVPFNPNNVDYTKLIDEKSVKRWRDQST